MPTRPAGLFDIFDSLDFISIEAVASWLKPYPQIEQLGNYLANRILYPQTLPMSETEMKIDLAILREALKMSLPQKNVLLGGNPFLNVTLRKIMIPAKFLDFIPDLKTLTWIFIDGLLTGRVRRDFFSDVWTVVLSDDSDEVIGSVILPQFEGNGSEMNLTVSDKTFKISPGSLSIIPCPKDRCEIAYSLHKGKVLGKQTNVIEIYGGKLGLVIDGREA